jgi:hypothetical protein
MEYENDQARKPEDVSTENLGFDIRSFGNKDEKRYIEVKGRSGAGSIVMTQNEWFKAKRFSKDYFLYVVLNTSTEPYLYCIQNPADTLQPDEKFEVRYLVGYSQIIKYSGAQ